MGRVSRKRSSKHRSHHHDHSSHRGTGEEEEVRVTTEENNNEERRHHKHHHKHRHHHRESSKQLVTNPARLVKNKIPLPNKTGSYDLTTSMNSLDLDEDVLNINNDKIRLNSAEPLGTNNNNNETNTTASTVAPTADRYDTMIIKPNGSDNNGGNYATSDEKIEFPKKCTCLGLPLTCFTYFAAVYSIVIHL